MQIIVTPLSAVEPVIAERGVSHLVSLLSPDEMISTPQAIRPENHLQIGVNDITQPGEDLVHPTETHVTALLDFVEGWDKSAPMLIHCWAGISRSTASAFITLCMLNPEHPEDYLAQLIRREGPTSMPNRLIVAHGDELLGRGGRMVDALDTMGPAQSAWEGRPFTLPAHPELAL